MMPLVNRTSSSMSSNNIEGSRGFSSHGSEGIQVQIIKACGVGTSTSFSSSPNEHDGREETDTLLSKSSFSQGVVGENMAITTTTDTSSSSIDFLLKMTTNDIIREIATAFVILITGWYGPKKIIVPIVMGGIRQRPIPYQISNDGSVILDFSLFHQLVPKDEVLVPSNPLIFIGVWLPWIIMMCVCYFLPIVPSSIRTSSTTLDNENISSSLYRRSLATLATCHILISTGLSEFTTQILKAYVGRLRPNFYQMCQYDTSTMSCMSSIHEQNESRQSFPSGHSSLSMQGMMSLSLFLIGQLWLAHRCGTTTTKRGTTITIPRIKPSMVSMWLAAVVPIWISLFVGATRLVDSWHHPSDVLAGWILGGWCAIVSYMYNFSSVSSLYDL